MDLLFMRTYVSVDCVVFGFNKNQLYVLLVRRNSPEADNKNLKLPGSLIF